MRADALAVLAEHRATRVPDLTARLVETILAGSPGYAAGDPVPRADLERSCRDNVERVLELLALAARDGLPREPRFYDAARATGHRRAEQGMPLHDVLQSFRIGGRLIWEDLVETSHDLLDAADLREVGTRLWEVVDETSARVAAAYHETERSLTRADEQRKASLWEGLLGGRGQDAAFALEALRLLDLPEEGPYVVVAATDHAVEPFRRAVAELRTPSQWVRRAVGVSGIVAGRRGSDLPRLVVGALSAAGLPVAAGVSAVATVPSDLGRASRQAALALQARAGRPGVAGHDATLPEALLLTAPEVAARLVGVWLGPVLALPPEEAQPLLATLGAWVDTGGSAVHTAEQVHCHRNTVVNRLRRVALLTSQPTVGSSPPPLELGLALRAHAVLPPG
jgi:phage tail protein X